MLTPHPGRLEEGPPVAAMIDCSPPLVNQTALANTDSIRHPATQLPGE